MALARSALALLTSRRVLTGLVFFALMAARWRLLGRPDDAELIAFVEIVLGWTTSEAKRRHANGSLARSRRLFISLLGLVLAGIAGRAGLNLGPEAQIGIGTFVAGLVFSEGERRHPDAREPALVVPLDGGGAPRADTDPSGVR